jgi:MFS family permease
MPSTSTSARVPFDLVGAALAGLGMAGLVFGFSTAGLDYLSVPTVMALILGGTAFFVAYLVHARRTPVPLLDFSLLRVQAFQASFFGGFAFRIGVAALTFLLPLLLQLGFGLDPFQSGLVTFSGALGALTMKTAAARILKRFGFRRVLLVNALVGSGFIAACAAFSYSTPFWLIIMVLLVGGFFRSLQFTAINVLAFAEVPPDRMSRATTLAAVGLQLSWSAGVALGAALVEYVTRHTASVITVADFSLAFLVVGAISASSVLLFLRLPADVCAELSGPAPLPARRN